MTSDLLAALAGAAVGALTAAAAHAIAQRRRPALPHRTGRAEPVAGGPAHLTDGVALRYSPDALGRWWPASILAAHLRRRGLRDWPEAVGIWWPEPGGAGVMACRACIERRPGAAVAGHRDSDQALVLTGAGARRRVERRCALHTGRFPSTTPVPDAPAGGMDDTTAGPGTTADPTSTTPRTTTGPGPIGDTTQPDARRPPGTTPPPERKAPPVTWWT